MKRLIITLTILTFAVAALAEDRTLVRPRTIVVRDGKVIHAGEPLEFDSLLAGKRAYIGVNLSEMSPALREHFGAPKDSGVLVDNVENGGPADKAGVRVGDIIVSVDGKDIESSWDLRNALRDKKNGDTVRIDVLRGRSRQTIVTTVAERELPRIIRGTNLEDLSRTLGETFSGPEWRARVERLQNCDELQTKLRELETRMKDLEKKLQK